MARTVPLPVAGLILDASGNLYGTTSEGGAYVYGTVFELTPKAGGGWTEKVLHSFGGTGDGISPYAGLIFDAAGNLYGTTSSAAVLTAAATVVRVDAQSGRGLDGEGAAQLHRQR